MAGEGDHAPAMKVPLLPPSTAEALARIVRDGREKSLGLVSAEATRLLDGVGHHISCVAVAFLATTLPSLRCHMIQRAMAFKLETEGSSLAETFGALTSGDVEDSISGMGASPLPALTELRVALRMPKPASRNEDALGTGTASHTFAEPQNLAAGLVGFGRPPKELLVPPLGDVRLKPCMPRPAPPVMPLTTAETVGVVGEACEEGPSLVLDPRAGSDWADLVSLRRAVASALKATLLPRGQALITEQFNKSPHLVFQCGLTAAKVQQLVEHNPAVAIEVLRLLTEEAPRRGARSLVDEWLGELVSGDMSLHSMEVVNCLASAGTLPQDMLRRFVSNCISQCERVDERRQTRLVRLVCVFLRTLIKTRAVDVEGLFVEVQAFCIEFARFRDAASLYRLLKASSPSLSPRNAP